MKNLMDEIKYEMAEALRLTRSGRLIEATALIQRALKGDLHKNGPSGSDEGAAEPAEASGPESRTSHEEKSFSDDMSSGQNTGADSVNLAAGSTAWPSLEGLWKIPGNLPGIQMPEAIPETPLPSVGKGRRRLIEGSFTNEAGTRAYKLYIPSTYVGQPLPLVVMLHGCTQSSTDFAVGTRMNALAEEEQFLVVYPEQAQNANPSRCWNWFEKTNQQRSAGEPSIIAGITKKIIDTYGANVATVYVVGMSAGGAMATIMAATYPELYAAVGVHSGLPYGAAHDLTSGFRAMQMGTPTHEPKLRKVIPLIMFHGDRDTTVAKINADHIRNQWLQAFESGGRPVGDPTIERGIVGGHAHTRFTYHDSDGQVILEEWIIHQAGHAWSGGSYNGSFTDPKGPDASAEIVRFLRKHTNLVRRDGSTLPG